MTCNRRREHPTQSPAAPLKHEQQCRGHDPEDGELDQRAGRRLREPVRNHALLGRGRAGCLTPDDERRILPARARLLGQGSSLRARSEHTGDQPTDPRRYGYARTCGLDRLQRRLRLWLGPVAHGLQGEAGARAFRVSYWHYEHKVVAAAPDQVVNLAGCGAAELIDPHQPGRLKLPRYQLA
jgi:hypothetical protein